MEISVIMTRRFKIQVSRTRPHIVRLHLSRFELIFTFSTTTGKVSRTKYLPSYHEHTFSRWTLLIISHFRKQPDPFPWQGSTSELRHTYRRIRSRIGCGSGVQIKIITHGEFLDKWPSKRRLYHVHACLMHIRTKASAPARRNVWAPALGGRACLIRMLILTKRLGAADHCAAPRIRSPPHKGK